MSFAIIGLALMFFIGHALNWFFSVTKIPDLLILVFAGFLLGPVFGILQPEYFGRFGDLISTLALVVILYEGGLNLSTKDLMSSSLPAMGLSILGIGLTCLFGFLACYVIGMQDWQTSLLVAIGVGSTSSAIVIPMVKQLSLQPRTKIILSLESAFTDVLAIVIFLVLVDGFASGEVSVQKILLGIGPKTLMAGFFGFISALIWAVFKQKFPNLIPKAFAGEAWALLTYGCIELLGLNGAIGVLSLGFTLTNAYLIPKFIRNHISTTAVTYKDMSLLKEITFLLKTFFFIYLGMLIKFSSLTNVAIALIISLLIFISRYVIVLSVFRKHNTPRLDAMISMAMGPRGLACAVLGTIPLQRGLDNGLWIQDTIFAIIPITIFITAVLVAVFESDTIREKFEKFFSKYSKSPHQEV